MDLARLEAVPLLADLPVADRAALAAVACETRAEAGDVLARDGVFEFELMAIEHGNAEIFRDGALVARLTAGDVVGEIGAFERRVANMTIVARTPLALITISGLDLRRLRCSAPAAVARMQGRLLRRRALVAG
jgi:CRP-like cAMP-binding protein